MLDYARMDAEVLLYLFIEQHTKAEQCKKLQEIELQCCR